MMDGPTASRPVPMLRRLFCLLLLTMAMLLPTAPAAAELHSHPGDDGTPVVRSLESLRDLDYQTWQLVAYREGKPGGPLRLRVVGYPGKVRLDHPTNLVVQAGVKEWTLPDITLENKALASDSRDAAAEFALDPLLNDLTNKRPLRLFLPGVLNDLPVPPFVVGEWRQVQSEPLS